MQTVDVSFLPCVPRGSSGLATTRKRSKREAVTLILALNRHRSTRNQPPPSPRQGTSREREQWHLPATLSREPWIAALPAAHLMTGQHRTSATHINEAYPGMTLATQWWGGTKWPAIDCSARRPGVTSIVLIEIIAVPLIVVNF